MHLDNQYQVPTHQRQNSHQKRKGLFKQPQPFLLHENMPKDGYQLQPEHADVDIATLPTRKHEKITLNPEQLLPYQRLDEELAADLDTSHMSTVKLMQLSGRLRAIRYTPARPASASPNNNGFAPGWQAGPTPYVASPSYYGSTFPAAMLPQTPQPFAPQQPAAVPMQPEPAKSKGVLKQPAVRITLGIIIGIIFLLLVSRIVNIPTTLAVLKQHLTTAQGIIDALLASASFIAAFSIRGTRWNRFLRSIAPVGILKSIQIYWVGVFINVLLPIQGGEVAKSLLLKRATGIPVSQSLPTVAMDKSLDLVPALVILAIVPFIPGIHMSPTLWFILALVSSILIGVVFVVGLAAWNRSKAEKFVQFMGRLIPGGIGKKIEGFAMGFVDTLLSAASRPKTFIPAIFLTAAAITCDGLFAMFAFWTVGVYMNFGQAIFGYTVFNMFSILPTPPGQVGSNELIGTIVFGGLLGFDKAGVLAMFVFSHPLTALIMATLCIICLSALGLNLSSALKAPPANAGVPAFEQGMPERQAAMT